MESCIRISLFEYRPRPVATVQVGPLGAQLDLAGAIPAARTCDTESLLALATTKTRRRLPRIEASPEAPSPLSRMSSTRSRGGTRHLLIRYHLVHQQNLSPGHRDPKPQPQPKPNPPPTMTPNTETHPKSPKPTPKILMKNEITEPNQENQP